MTYFRHILTAAFALCAATAQAQQSLQMPARPEPVPVTLNPATTAMIVFDLHQSLCPANPTCTGQVLPAATPFVARARKAGLPIFYGTPKSLMGDWIKDVAPAPGDVKIESFGQDRFYNTDLDKKLKEKGITTIVMVGWKVNGALNYTSVGATLRGYTVVIPVDTTSSATDYEVAIGFFQILNQMNGNAKNEALKPKATTLSRTDLITFQPAK